MGDRLGGQPGEHRHASGDLHDGVDLDGGVERQRGHADGGAGMLAGIAQHVDEQVGGAVDDEVLFDKVGRRGRRSTLILTTRLMRPRSPRAA